MSSSLSLHGSRTKVDCVLCGPGATTVAARRGINRIVRCDRCGLRFVDPQPTAAELEAWYDPQYFRVNPDKFLSLPMVAPVRTRLDDYVRLVRRHGHGGRLLDVGCGTGFFLLRCRAAGIEGRGVEFSPYAAEHGRQRFGIDIVDGLLQDQAFEPASFDTITMWDLLEHTTDPRIELAAVRRLLRPGGRLLLTVPNSGSLMARVTGSRWIGYDHADEHLWYFTRRTLRRMLDAAGFAVDELRPHGWICDLDFVATRGRKFQPRLASWFGAAVTRLRLGSKLVRFPSINLFAAASRRPSAAEPAGATLDRCR